MEKMDEAWDFGMGCMFVFFFAMPSPELFSCQSSVTPEPEVIPRSVFYRELSKVGRFGDWFAKVLLTPCDSELINLTDCFCNSGRLVSSAVFWDKVRLGVNLDHNTRCAQKILNVQENRCTATHKSDLEWNQTVGWTAEGKERQKKDIKTRRTHRHDLDVCKIPIYFCDNKWNDKLLVKP